MGLATVGGLGIVLLAITLDRITQAMGQPSRGARHWWQTGPAGLVLRVLPLLRTAKSKTSAAPARPSAQTVAAKPAAAASATTGAEPQGA
jgi:glycine betaine/proline transport system permease protein